MTPHAGQQIVAIYISQEVNAIRQSSFFQLLGNDLRNMFLQKSWRKWGQETSSRTSFVFIYFGRPYFRRLISISDCWFRDILFWLFIKSLGTRFSTKFPVWFFKKNIFHAIFYLMTNVLFWRPLLLQILGNICIVIAFCIVLTS